MSTTAVLAAVGKATIFGMDAITLTPTTIAAYACIHDSAKFSHKFKLGEIVDESGNDCQLNAVNEMIEGDVDFKLSGTGRAAAKSGTLFIPPLSKVALAGITTGPAGVAARSLNGDYIYVGDAAVSFKAGDNATFTMKLRQYVDSTQNALLTTAVTA